MGQQSFVIPGDCFCLLSDIRFIFSMVAKMLIFVLLLFLFAQQIQGLDNGQALLPPLIISTNQLGCNYDQVFLGNQINQIAVSQLATKGFKYLILQDCWQGQRNATTGRISEDKNRFPNGLKNLIAYANSKGIKIGLGTDIGLKTRLGRQGSQDYEKIDSLTYAQWGVEWITLYNSQNVLGYRPRFTLMSQYLQEASKKIAIGLNNNNVGQIQIWASSIANTWTTSSQMIKSWEGLSDALVDQCDLQIYAKSGSWNDAGFLSTVLPNNQFLTQLAAWLALKSPLKIQAPISSYDSFKLSLLLKDQLLQINQDQLKKQARLLRHQQFQKGWQQVWGGPLSGNRYVLVFINGLSTTSPMSVSLAKEAKISNVANYWTRDPVASSSLGSSSSDTVSVAKVASHSAQVRVLGF